MSITNDIHICFAKIISVSTTVYCSAQTLRKLPNSMYNYQKCPSLSQIQYFVHHHVLFAYFNEYAMKNNDILSLFVKFEMLAVWNFPADLFRSVKSWRIGPVPTGVHAIFPNSWMEKKKNPETNILIVSVLKAYLLSFYT